MFQSVLSKCVGFLHRFFFATIIAAAHVTECLVFPLFNAFPTLRPPPWDRDRIKEIGRKVRNVFHKEGSEDSEEAPRPGGCFVPMAYSPLCVSESLAYDYCRLYIVILYYITLLYYYIVLS